MDRKLMLNWLHINTIQYLILSENIIISPSRYLITIILVNFFSYSPVNALADCNKSAFKISIDVGHSITKPGAISARGIPEFFYNTELAHSIEKKIIANGFSKTKVIRIQDSNNEIHHRISIINSSNPDLLLSIHHDSAQEEFLKQWDYEGSMHYYTDDFEGWSIFVSSKNNYLNESITFAQYLGSALLKQDLIFSTHHNMNIKGERKKMIDPKRGIYNYENLAILKGAKTPALLVEAGIIVNRNEETKVSSFNFREKFTKSITESVEKYCNFTSLSQ